MNINNILNIVWGAVTINIFLAYHNNWLITIFSLVFIQIQLAEYFMWLDQNCGKINHYATIYAHIILILEPISILFGALIYKTLILPKIYIYISIIILLIPLILVVIMNIKNKKKLCSKEEKSEYLEWNFVNGNIDKWPKYYNIILIFMLIPWLFFKNKLKGILSFLILVLTFLFSKINTTNLNLKFKQWESKWCIVGAIYPLIFLILKYIK